MRQMLSTAAIALVVLTLGAGTAEAVGWDTPIKLAEAPTTSTGGPQPYPSVAAGPDGTAAIAWTEEAPSPTDSSPSRVAVRVVLTIIGPSGLVTPPTTADVGYSTGEHPTAMDASGQTSVIPFVDQTGRVYVLYTTVATECTDLECGQKYRVRVREFSRGGSLVREVLVAEDGRVFSDGRPRPIVGSPDGGVDLVWVGTNTAGDFSDQQPVTWSRISGAATGTGVTHRTIGDRPAGQWIAMTQLAEISQNKVAASWVTGGWTTPAPQESHLVHADTSAVTGDLLRTPALTDASSLSLVPDGSFYAWFSQPSNPPALRRAHVDGNVGPPLRYGSTFGENPVSTGPAGHACGFSDPDIFPASGGVLSAALPVQAGDPAAQVLGSVATHSGGCLFAYPMPYSSNSRLMRVAYVAGDGTSGEALRWVAPSGNVGAGAITNLAEGRPGQFITAWTVWDDAGKGQVWASQLNDQADKPLTAPPATCGGPPLIPCAAQPPVQIDSPAVDPCARVNGSLLDKLAASLKCSAAQTVNQVKCGVGVAQLIVAPLKSLKFATTARGYLDLRKISDKRLHPIARFYNRYLKGQYARTGLPAGFNSPKEILDKISAAKDVYGLVKILVELSDNVSMEEAQDAALALTDIAGVKACVEGLALAME